jgi:hypothetical protein
MQSSLVCTELSLMFHGGDSGSDRTVAEGMLKQLHAYRESFIVSGAKAVIEVCVKLMQPISSTAGGLDHWALVRQGLKTQHVFMKHVVSLPLIKPLVELSDNLLVDLRKDQLALEKITAITGEFDSKHAETVKGSRNAERTFVRVFCDACRHVCAK